MGGALKLQTTKNKEGGCVMGNAKDALYSAQSYADDAKDKLDDLICSLGEIEEYLDNEDEIEELKEKIEELEGEKEEWEARESVLEDKIAELKGKLEAIHALCIEAESL